MMIVAGANAMPQRSAPAIAMGSLSLSTISPVSTGTRGAFAFRPAPLNLPAQQSRNSGSFGGAIIPNTPWLNARIGKSWVYIIRAISMPHVGTPNNVCTGAKLLHRDYILLNSAGWVVPSLEERFECRRSHTERYEPYLDPNYEGLPKMKKRLAQPAKGEHDEYVGPCLIGELPAAWNEVAVSTLDDV
jgi:hypothetical protein